MLCAVRAVPGDAHGRAPHSRLLVRACMRPAAYGGADGGCGQRLGRHSGGLLGWPMGEDNDTFQH